MVNVLERNDVRNEMRKINNNLQGDLNDYNKDQQKLQEMLARGTFNENDIRKATEKLIERRMEIAEKVGQYGLLEGAWGREDVASLRAQTTAAETMLKAPLVQVPESARERFSPLLETILRNDSDFANRQRNLRQDNERSGREITGLQTRMGSTRDTGKLDDLRKDVFNEQLRVAGRAAALNSFTTVRIANPAASTPTPAPVATTPPTAPTTPAPVAAAPTTPAPTPATPATPQFADARAAYRAIQTELKGIGLYGGAVDGNPRRFDGQTQILSQTQKGFQDLSAAISGGNATAAQKAAFEKMQPAIDYLKANNGFNELTRQLPASAPKPALNGITQSADVLVRDAQTLLRNPEVKDFDTAIRTYAQNLEKAGGPKYDETKVNALITEMKGYYYWHRSDTGAMKLDDPTTLPRLTSAMYAYQMSTQGVKFSEFSEQDGKYQEARTALDNVANASGMRIAALSSLISPAIQRDNKLTLNDLLRQGVNGNTNDQTAPGVQKNSQDVVLAHARDVLGPRFNAESQAVIDLSNPNRAANTVGEMNRIFNVGATANELSLVTQNAVAQTPKPTPPPSPNPNQTQTVAPS